MYTKWQVTVYHQKYLETDLQSEIADVLFKYNLSLASYSLSETPFEKYILKLLKNLTFCNITFRITKDKLWASH